MQNMKLIDEIEEMLKDVSMPVKAHNERAAIMQHFRTQAAKEQEKKRKKKKSASKTKSKKD